MSFGSRISRALTLMRQCWHLLMANKSLLVLPIISGVVFLAVIASFATPIIVSDEFRKLIDGEAPDTEYIDYIYGFAFYLVSFTVITFFNAALIHCVLVRMRGGECSVADGLGLAAKRFPQIIGWSLVSATVGLILNVLRDRAGPLGSFIAGLGGLAWSVATYFVVPVLVVDGVGPLGAIQRSASILRKVWGESLVANFGLGILAVFATLALAGVAALAAATLPNEAVIGVVVVVILAWATMALVFSALSVILQAAIYDYATTGRVGGPFDKAQLDAAFSQRR